MKKYARVEKAKNTIYNKVNEEAENAEKRNQRALNPKTAQKIRLMP